MNTRNYELMLVLSPELDESALETLIDRIKRFLDNAQAQVFNFKSWGLRRLAYVILGHREGRYYVVHFEANPETCPELERNITLTDGILRHLLTRTEVFPAEEPVVVNDVAEPAKSVLSSTAADSAVAANSAVAADVAPAAVEDAMSEDAVSEDAVSEDAVSEDAVSEEPTVENDELVPEDDAASESD